jgi:hypothetical protein
MLVEVSDLQNYMDISFSNRQKIAAGYILEGLQSELESFIGKPLEITEFTETYRLSIAEEPLPLGSLTLYGLGPTGPYGGQTSAVQSPAQLLSPPITVYFRNTPVLSVSSVTVTAPSLGASAVAQVPGVDYISSRFGIDLYNVWSNDFVEVTYVAGLDGPSVKIFKLLILRAASREAQNMHDDVVGIKDLNPKDVSPMSTGFTQDELKSVDNFRRKQVG